MAFRLLYHSALGLRVMKSKREVQTNHHVVSTKDDGWAQFDNWLGARGGAEGDGARTSSEAARLALGKIFGESGTDATSSPSIASDSRLTCSPKVGLI